MAISAGTVFEVRHGGSDTNGGGFDPTTGGTDYTLQDAAQIAVTDAVANGTTTITSATAGFTTAHVGNLIYLSGGTGVLTGTWRQVASRTDASTIVVDATVAAGTGITLNLGGAFATPGQAAALMVGGGNIIYIKYSATPYSISSSNNVAGGRLSLPVGVSSKFSHVIGYDTNRTLWNTDANRPILNVAAASTTVITPSNYALVRNISFTNSGANASCTCMSMNTFNQVDNCYSSGYSTAFNNGGTGTCTFTNCEVTAFTVNAFHASSLSNNTRCINCSVHDWTTTTAIGFNGLATMERCTAYNGYDAGFLLEQNALAINCIADNIQSTGDGFNFGGSSPPVVMINCIATRCGSNGFNGGSSTNFSYYMFNCAGSGNGANYSSGMVSGYNIIGDIVLSGMPYAGGGSFDLNNTVGAGAALKAAGYPAVQPPGMTQHLDVGLIQGSSVDAGRRNYAF